nr:MAG TPA: hypothetical protein [Caudoviricetes sp.]
MILLHYQKLILNFFTTIRTLITHHSTSSIF